MAAKTKTPKNVTIVPDAKPVRLKKDGTPWAPSIRRSNADILATWVAKRDALIAAHAKTLAKYEARIERFSTVSVSGEDALKDLVSDGYTPDEIVALEAKLRKAKAALKGKSPEELAALTPAAPPIQDWSEEDDTDEGDDE